MNNTKTVKRIFRVIDPSGRERRQDAHGAGEAGETGGAGWREARARGPEIEARTLAVQTANLTSGAVSAASAGLPGTGTYVTAGPA